MYLGLCHNYTSTAAQIICLSLLEVTQHTATRSPSLSVAHDAIDTLQVLLAHANENRVCH